MTSSTLPPKTGDREIEDPSPISQSTTTEELGSAEGVDEGAKGQQNADWLRVRALATSQEGGVCLQNNPN
eukprot:scaffold305_cov110-Cylindrotheca_fusiformis.AAC.23